MKQPNDFGAYTYGEPIVRKWSNDGKLIIGKFCSIADNVQIFLGGNHRTDWVSTYPFPARLLGWPVPPNLECEHPTSKGDVVIGNDVWLCSHTMILSGVTIGDGAVVAAGAVVVKDVQPYSVVCGIPAKLTKYRFSAWNIEALLKIRWWDWPREKIEANMALFCSKDIDKFISSFV